MHVVGVDFQGLLPGDGEGFLFYEAVGDVVGGCGCFEDGGVIDGAVAQFYGLGFFCRWLAAAADEAGGEDEVFYVEHGDAVAEFVEERDGVASADDDPAAVHFYGDFGGVGEAHEFDEGSGAVGGGELDGVVVVAEFHAGGGDFFADLVELVGVPFPVVHDESFAVLVGGGFAGEGTDDVAQAEVVAEGDDLV